jgi:hypothetical protein
MKVVSTLTLVLAALLGRVPLQAEVVWRLPQLIPTPCSEVRTVLLLMDVSGSMNAMNRLDLAKASATKYLVSDAPDCTLAIVASFGITADVVGAEFLTGQENRFRLAELVRHVVANHPYTNLDEAAKLVELLNYQLQAVYGRKSADLSVRVYSDLISAPSVGKSQFSLSEFLADRLAAQHPRLTADTLPEEQHIQIRPSPPALSDQNRGITGGGSTRVSGIALLLAAAGLLVSGLVLLIWLRFRSSGRPPRVSGLECLLVTESASQPDAKRPEVLVRDRRVPVAPGVPTLFSTDANSATYVVALVPGAAEGELFRVEPLTDGSVRIRSPHPRLTVNDEPLDVDRRLKVDIREPIRVCLGRREFNITGVFGHHRTADRGYDVFDAEPLQH